MRVAVICDKWNHHSAHSGYDQLSQHLEAEQLAPGLICRLLHKVPKTIGPAFPDIWEQWRIPYHSARELDVFFRSLFRRPRIYHFLYGENTVRILPHIKRPGARIVCTFHQPQEMLEKAEKLHRTVAKLDGIIVLARHQIPFYEKFAPSEKIFFVPHGIDTRHFSPATGRRDPRCLLFVGNWLRDFKTLVGIARQLARLRPEIMLDVVSLKDNLHHFDGLPNIRFHAGISENDLIALYRNAALLVMPLLGATANNALLEAMAAGLPIVTNDVGGVRDYVDNECACILPSLSAPAFTEKILALLKDERKRNEMSAAARARAMQYDWTEIARQMHAVYHAILQNE
jgi:glycosyltransferase involved in cell wall biosynthesis